MEGLTLQMCFAGLTPWSVGSPLSKPIEQAIEEATGNSLGDVPWSEEIDPTLFLNALTRAGQDKLATFAAGISAYQGHGHRRVVSPPERWAEAGTLPILNYGGSPHGQPVLVVPSLINKAYVLDLFEDRSFMRALAARGFRPYLLDWTSPDHFAAETTVDDYIERSLIPALETIKRVHGQSAVLVGYCMGGTLTIAPAVLRPDLVSALVLLAAPWDFHADSEGLRHWLAVSRSGFEATLDSLGQAPVDLIQGLFAGLDPTLVGRKFRSFAAMDPESDGAKRFVVLEDWLNDGVPLAGPVARTCLLDWYLENTTLKQEWRVGATAIRPQDINCPTLAVIPSRDRIVPPRSAESLANAIPGATVQSVALGHIGMMAGSRADKEVYEPVADWIINAASQ
jgi:polyhydroxyalkanoate synthase subunit PhaC